MSMKVTDSKRRTHVQDALVANEVLESRRRFAQGDETISLAEIVLERRAKKSGDDVLKHTLTRYMISEYEQ